MKTLTRLFALAACSAIILVSPGLGCYEALAQLSAVRGLPAGGPPTGGLAAVGLDAGAGLSAAPAGALGLEGIETLDSVTSMAPGAADESALIRSGSSSRTTFSRLPTGEGEATRIEARDGVSLQRASVQSLNAAGAEVRTLLKSRPAAAVAAGEADAGRADAIFGALVHAKSQVLPTLSDALPLDGYRPLSAPERVLHAAPEGPVRLAPAPREPKKADLSGRLTAFTVTLGLPGYFLTYPLLAPFAHAGALLSFAAAPALLFGVTHLAIASMTLMSERTPKALRKLPAYLLLATGLTLAAVGAGASIAPTGLAAAITGGSVYGVALAASSWGLLRAAAGNDAGSLGKYRMLASYTGSLFALAGAGLYLLGPAGGLATLVKGAGYLAMLELAIFIPGAPARKLAAGASLLPIVLFALPLAHVGALPIAVAVAATSLAAGALPLLKESSSKNLRSLGPVLISFSGALAFLLGLSPVTAAFTLLGALGLRNHLLRQPYSNDSAASERFLLNEPQSLGLSLVSTALVAASWAQVLSIGGLPAGLLTIGASALSTAVLIPRIHKSVRGALIEIVDGFAKSFAGFSGVTLYWVAKSALLENLREYSRKKLDASWWNGVPLALLWTPVVAVIVLDGALAVLVSVKSGLLRAPINGLWGAFKALGWTKATAFMQAYVDATYDLLEGGFEKNFEPWANGRVKTALDTKGAVTPTLGLAAAHLLMLAWFVRTAAVALASPFIALVRAARAMRAPQAPKK